MGTSEGVILDDGHIADADPDQLRQHYIAAANAYHERVGIADPIRREDIGKAYAATVKNYVTVIEAAESNEGQILFEPLTENELKEVSSWSIGEFDE
jgi:hypothetical protein